LYTYWRIIVSKIGVPVDSVDIISDDELDASFESDDGSTYKFPSAEGYEVSPDWKPTVDRPLPALRCYYVRPDGTRCKRFAVRGTGLNGTNAVCPSHGGSLPPVKAYADSLVISARMKLIENTEFAVDTLIDFLKPGVTGDAIRLKAATEILDRAGVKGAMEMKVEVTTNAAPSETINDRLAQIAARLAPKPEEELEVIDVVDNPPPAEVAPEPTDG
jgi:hypothetical protein